jgi:hypothetical protein
MERRQKHDTPETRAFFDEVARLVAASGLSSRKISMRAGMSEAWLRVHICFGHPWQSRTINKFCKGANVAEEDRLRLHRLAVKALGYEAW